MPSKEALRERIELLESRLWGQPVTVLNLRMREKHALADILIGQVRKSNRRYFYSQFFKASQLRLFA